MNENIIETEHFIIDKTELINPDIKIITENRPSPLPGIKILYSFYYGDTLPREEEEYFISLFYDGNSPRIETTEFQKFMGSMTESKLPLFNCRGFNNSIKRFYKIVYKSVHFEYFYFPGLTVTDDLIEKGFFYKYRYWFGATPEVYEKGFIEMYRLFITVDADLKDKYEPMFDNIAKAIKIK